MNSHSAPPEATKSILRLTLFLAAAAACSSGSTSVNHATLHFALPVYYPAQGGTALAIGDFDGDGAKDIAIGGAPNLIAFGAGDGTFSTIVEVAAGLDVAGLVAHDLNGDGRDDLVIGTTLSDLYVGLGEKQQNLTAAKQTIGMGGASMYLADVDGDGIADLVASDREGTGTAVNYLAASGQSVRTFFFYSAFNAGYAADLNGDGRADLVGSGTDVALTGTNGEPGPFTTFPIAATGCGSIAGVDVNGDGLVDAISEDLTHSIYAQLAKPDGTLGGAIVTQNPFGSGDSSVAGFGDFDGDGVPDAISYLSGPDATMGFIKGDGAGGFSRFDSDLSALPAELIPPAIGDLDGDGLDDVVLVVGQNVVVVLNRTH